MSNVRINSVLDIVLPMLSGKKLLDIGCIGHDYHARLSLGTFYLEKFSKVAKEYVGIDILEDSVAAAKADGYSVVVGDAETYIEACEFDVIFAGELIEHVNNAGVFLASCSKNLKNDGRLIITTPNTFSFSRVFRVVCRMTNEPPLNVEHTCYYTPQTLMQLYSRYNFELEHLFYSDYDYGKIEHKPSKRLFLMINRKLSNWFPQFSQSIVIVLRKLN